MKEKNIIEICNLLWDKHKDDCSRFVRAVVKAWGAQISGNANMIVESIQKTPWKVLESGIIAKKMVEENNLVIGGLAAPGHGHVVIIVPGDLNRAKYPTAYWGKLGSVGKKKTTINWAWSSSDRDKVIYSQYIG